MQQQKGQPPVLQEKWLAFFHGFAGIKPQPLPGKLSGIHSELPRNQKKRL